MLNHIIFQQLFEAQSSTYSYLIADPISKAAALIDPVLETVDRDLSLIKDMDLQLIYVLETHIHADHITGAGQIRKRLDTQIGVSHRAGASCADIQLEDGQSLALGDKKIQVLETPGHTNTCLSFYFEGCVFTGDALLIRGSGRTDFQEGSAETLYQSVTQKLFQLPEETLVYPGHDYRGLTSSTVALEKKLNPRLGGGRSQSEFVKIMSELKLAQPKKLDQAVKANLQCGLGVDNRSLRPQVVDGIPEVSVEDVHLQMKSVRLIDVRRPDEFDGELHHIPGAELVTLGEDLEKFLEQEDREQEMVFICRSGGRSGQATAKSIEMGFTKTVNMVGGMLRWNQANLPVE